jgi:hypothetical protein
MQRSVTASVLPAPGLAERSALQRVPLCPALSHRGHKFFLVLPHFPDERLIAGFFVRGRPQDHFCEHRSKIDTFGGEQINQFSSIVGIPFRGDNSIGFQPPQAVGQYIGRDSFVGLQEFFVRPEAAEHHVADDQERPAIAQHFDGSIQRAPGPAFWTRLLRHFLSIAYFTCILQVTWADLLL